MRKGSRLGISLSLLSACIGATPTSSEETVCMRKVYCILLSCNWGWGPLLYLAPSIHCREIVHEKNDNAYILVFFLSGTEFVDYMFSEQKI